MMNYKEIILNEATSYANKSWDVHENPNEHDNAHDDFIAGAMWALKKFNNIMDNKSKDIMKNPDFITEFPAFCVKLMKEHQTNEMKAGEGCLSEYWKGQSEGVLDNKTLTLLELKTAINIKIKKANELFNLQLMTPEHEYAKGYVMGMSKLLKYKYEVDTSYYLNQMC